MTMDLHTKIVVKLSASAAVNSLPGLRLAVTEALENGLSKEEVNEIIDLALEIQKQPYSYTQHLKEQLLKDTSKKKSTHVHSCGCGCHT